MSGDEYNACSSSLCNFLHSALISPLLAPIILLSTLFSNTLNLFSSLKVGGQVSQPYDTAPFLYGLVTFQVSNLIFLFLCRGRTGESVQCRGICVESVTVSFLRRRVVNPSTNPESGGPPLIGCPRLLNEYVRSYSPYLGGRLPYAQSEVSPCCVRQGPTWQELVISDTWANFILFTGLQ